MALKIFQKKSQQEDSSVVKKTTPKIRSRSKRNRFCTVTLLACTCFIAGLITWFGQLGENLYLSGIGLLTFAASLLMILNEYSMVWTEAAYLQSLRVTLARTSGLTPEEIAQKSGVAQILQDIESAEPTVEEPWDNIGPVNIDTPLPAAIAPIPTGMTRAAMALKTTKQVAATQPVSRPQGTTPIPGRTVQAHRTPVQPAPRKPITLQEETPVSDEFLEPEIVATPQAQARKVAIPRRPQQTPAESTIVLPLPPRQQAPRPAPRAVPRPAPEPEPEEPEYEDFVPEDTTEFQEAEPEPEYEETIQDEYQEAEPETEYEETIQEEYGEPEPEPATEPVVPVARPVVKKPAPRPAVPQPQVQARGGSGGTPRMAPRVVQKPAPAPVTVEEPEPDPEPVPEERPTKKAATPKQVTPFKNSFVPRSPLQPAPGTKLYKK